MGAIYEDVRARGAEIRAAVGRHKGLHVALFGSVARGEERPDSDVDFLVEFEHGSSLFDLLHLSDELESLLGRPVDVISVGGLRERDRQILDEALPL